MKNKIETIEALGFSFKVIRSARRRTVEIRAGDEGLEILCPVGVPKSELIRIVGEHSGRIAEISLRADEQSRRRESFSLDIGDEIRYLGRRIPLKGREGNLIGYDDDCFFVPEKLPPERIIGEVERMYRLAAKNYIIPRTYELALEMKLRPASIKINSARTHWATCSAKGGLNFTWFTVMAEPAAIDYIIIHELCHMTELNHSPRFWKLVAERCPDYKDKKKYLDSLWREILSENW